ncbi:MAG TPA: hypothetical protein VGP82_07630 [Ktedonobacterales bacterium]|jgi:uncharacterized membrane protein|nr:hypothetical protein [Ktedonobacterales bacterium]
MAGPERQNDAHDDFTAEVSDLRSEAETVSTERPAPFLTLARRTTRQHVTRLLVIVSAPLLVLLIVLGANPAVRAGLGSLVPGFEPAATPAAVTSSNDLFYLLPNPPGVDVSLDGYILAHPPAPGNSHPLKLSPGRHTFTWRSRLLPFTRLSCHVSVLSSATDSCPLVPSRLLPFQFAGRPGAIIGMHESLSTLDANDAQQLKTAIQGALDAVQSTAGVETAEPHVAAQAGLSPTPAFAQQPLRAVRSYAFVGKTGYPEPCILAQPAIPCRFPGQDCNTVCTVEQPPESVRDLARTWIAAAMVRSTWSYYTADGDAVAVQVPESYGIQLTVLRITRGAGLWHVSAIIGHTPGLDAADDPICDPARYALAQTALWSFMVTNPPPARSCTSYRTPRPPMAV